MSRVIPDATRIRRHHAGMNDLKSYRGGLVWSVAGILHRPILRCYIGWYTQTFPIFF